jgi:hypothetical protein
MSKETEIDEQYNEFHIKIYDLLLSYKSIFNPQQVTCMLIKIGSSCAYFHAPNKKEAEELIKKAVEFGYKEFQNLKSTVKTADLSNLASR